MKAFVKTLGNQKIIERGGTIKNKIEGNNKHIKSADTVVANEDGRG